MESDKKVVNDKRVILGLDRNKKLRPNRTRADRPPVSSNNTLNQLTQFKKTNAKHKRTIVDLKMDTTTNELDDVNMKDASDEFCGKSKKPKSK